MKNKEFITYGFLVDLDYMQNSCSGKQENLLRSMWLNKPSSGLWGSPVDSSYGWKDWCINNDYNTSAFNVYTKWRLKDNARVLVIDSYEDFTKAMDIYGCKSLNEHYCLDFTKIKRDYDGMYLTERGNYECHYPDYDYKDYYHISLNSWDCESIVVWNPDMIEITETYKE